MSNATVAVDDGSIDNSGPEKRKARAIVRARRSKTLAAFLRQYAKSPVGLTGAMIIFALCAVAVLAPVLASQRGLDASLVKNAPMQPPSFANPFGTDELGRPVLTLVVWGTRVSLLVGIVAALISVSIGTVAGLVAGYYSDWRGSILMRLTDWFLVIPFLPLAIVLASILGPSMLNIIIVIGVTSWPATARLVRAQTLSVRSRPYVERARALGGGSIHVIAYHILPNVAPIVVANTVLVIGIAVMSETTLSFLGLGDAMRPSWGMILHYAFVNGAILAGAWGYLLAPGLAIVALILAFTLCARTLEAIVTSNTGRD